MAVCRGYPISCERESLSGEDAATRHRGALAPARAVSDAASEKWVARNAPDGASGAAREARALPDAVRKPAHSARGLFNNAPGGDALSSPQRERARGRLGAMEATIRT